MSHKQSGYAAAETTTGFVAILHKTPVVELRGTTLVFNNGGWVTMSTQKAMNGALRDLNLGHRFWIGRKKGEMILTYKHAGGERLIPFKSNRLVVDRVGNEV